MGVQIPHSFYPEASQKDAVRTAEEAPGRGVSSVGAAEGESDPRRAHDGRSRAYADVDPAEVCGVTGGGIHEGEECDSSGSVRGEEEKLCGATFLGPRATFCRR